HRGDRDRDDRRGRPSTERFERRDGEHRDRSERGARSSYRSDFRPARGEHRGDRPRGGYERGHRADHHVEKLRRQDNPPQQLADRGPVEDAPVAEDNGFAALGLPDAAVRRLARGGITQPFPIQAATIPDALAGKDVLGRGQTGSGKTMAFGLPTLTRLAQGEPSEPKRPRALVLVPTRELAMQVSDALEPIAHVLGLRHKLVAGGLAYTSQIAALERGVDLLIATPGRLMDLLDRGAVRLDGVTIAVLDEADHMADMGFLPDVTAILDQVPAGGQRLLFSATLDNGIDELVERYLNEPTVHSTDEPTASVTTMDHHVLLIQPQHKKIVTAQVANREGRTIVFVRTKLGADRVAREIREQGVLAAALHGGLNQGARNRVLAAFKDGRMPVLVATDVAARGIHVDEVSVVLQVDPPRDHKDYLHRAGRTARAGERGAVVTLALPHQRRSTERLLRTAGVEATPVEVGPGDDSLLAATGARRTSGIPVPEESYQRIVEGRPKRSFRGGPRQGRPGRGGGYRGRDNGRRREGGERMNGYDRG
ncbi:DEAD/DEAH box helicase, partial [Austwickia chelonae]